MRQRVEGTKPAALKDIVPEPLPARTAVVTGLVGGTEVEIHCVAVVRP
jgi:enamine deaminase RidA (YjgF/YER057c/UK114 family)